MKAADSRLRVGVGIDTPSTAVEDRNEIQHGMPGATFPPADGHIVVDRGRRNSIGTPSQQRLGRF